MIFSAEPNSSDATRRKNDAADGSVFVGHAAPTNPEKLIAHKQRKGALRETNGG